jgi:type VI secretion system secreted protein Hcp
MPADNFVWFPAPATGGLLVNNANQPQGETKDKFFLKKNAFECKSIAFGVEQAQTSGSATSGSAAGKAKLNPFKVTKDVDKASCAMFGACVGGAHFPTMNMAVRKTGGTNLVYLQYIFRQVFITEITWEGGSGEENPVENVTFVYGALGMQYVQQKPDGTVGITQMGYWSAITNKTTLDIPTATGPKPEFLSGGDIQQV